MQPSPTDVCSLYLNMATLAALPRRCARHNAPSHANFITKLVRSTCLGVDEYVVVSCHSIHHYIMLVCVANVSSSFHLRLSVKDRMFLHLPVLWHELTQFIHAKL